MTEPANPPHWQDAMDKAGLGSRTRLGIAAGIPTSTVTGLITGERGSSERTMQAVADALGLEVTTIREWAAQARGESVPYQPPAEANRLNRRQRKAIDELIRSIVAQGADEDSDRGATVEELRPPRPDLSRVAARRGGSKGRRAREQQDRDADTP